MTAPDPSPAMISVAGLRIPAALAARIISALRGIYPTITDGLGDEAAVRAVLIHWITITLDQYESGQPLAGAGKQVEQIQANAVEQSKKIRAAVHAAAQLIEEAPAPEPDPTPTDPPL